MSVISRKIDKIIWFAMILIIVGAVIKSLVVDPGNGKIPTGKIMRINEQWEKVQENEAAQYQEYEYKIPRHIDRELMFSMENSWAAITVFLDGQKIHSCEDTYKELGARRIWLELPGNSAGKILTLRINGGSKVDKRVMSSPMYIGEKNAVFLEGLRSGLYAFVFFIFTLILAFLIFISQIALRKRLPQKNIKEMLYLELFILNTGIWVLTDSKILQMFTEKTAIVSIISFTTFLMIPVFMLLLIKEMMVFPWKMFDSLLRIALINTILVIGVFLLRIMPIYKLLFLQHLLIIVAIPIILKNGITEVRRYKNQGMKKILTGFGIIALCGVISLGLFYVNSSVDYAYFYSAGFLMFMICLAGAVFEEIYIYLERNAKTAVYREMAYVDSMTGLKNRVAFEQLMKEVNSEKGLTYIVFDNNNLKRTNDTYGHQAGDELLKDTAECIRETFGRLGKCFRIGGDEFLVVLQGMTEKEIKDCLECFECKVEAMNEEREIPIEIAYGYFCCEDKAIAPEEIFKKADENMYLKKQGMR